MNISSIKLAILAVTAMILMTGCEGYAKAGVEHQRSSAGIHDTRFYGEIGASWLVNNYSNSMLNSYSGGSTSIDPSTWELELDPSFGLSTSIQGNNVLVRALSNKSSVNQQSFPLTIQGNRARFANPEAVGLWISNQSHTVDAFRVEVLAVTVDNTNNGGSVTARWREGSQVLAQSTQGYAPSSPCGGPGESDVIIIC